MKVYRVVMNYFDGDHDHGRYESPLFSNADAANAFLRKLCAIPSDDYRYWWTDAYPWDQGPEHRAHIEEYEVLDEAPEPGRAEEYRTITYS